MGKPLLLSTRLSTRVRIQPESGFTCIVQILSGGISRVMESRWPSVRLPTSHRKRQILTSFQERRLQWIKLLKMEQCDSCASQMAVDGSLTRLLHARCAN